MEIGCGPGNMTKLYNDSLNIGTFIAIDIDSKMIKFAETNYPAQNTTYIAQDFGVKWDKLSPEVRALENRVNLIVSNHTMHWIFKQRENAANNIRRLLADQGLVYLQFACLPYYKDVVDNAFLSFLTGIGVFIGSITSITVVKQRSGWINAMTNNGLKLIQDSIEDKTCEMPINVYNDSMSKVYYYFNIEQKCPGG